MLSFLKLLVLHRSLYHGLRFAARYVSRLLVLCPNTYLVVGLISDEALPGLLERLRWFYREKNVKFVVRRPQGYEQHSGLDSLGRRPVQVGRVRAMLAGLSGKVLVYDYNRNWRRLDNYLRYKVFIINWTRDYRDSSWRMAAAVSTRPFAHLSRTFSRREKRQRKDRVAVVGNGPSASNIFSPEFAEMDVIICNTAIKSEKLLAERNIVAVCFTDATFFLGPSAYATAFYTALQRAAAQGDFAIYLDFEHESFVRSRLPGLAAERIIPIYLDNGIRLRADFSKGHAHPACFSVFTTLMLPLAATYYREIYLVGFDGKNPEMKNYFWKHSDEFQFTELLPSVRASDPGFFAGVDYVGFSEANEKQTDTVLKCVEGSGVSIQMTHPSFIEPLRRRYEAQRNAGPS